MRCTIEIRGGNRAEAEHRIRDVQKRWGYDWNEIECRLLTPSGALLEVVCWAPLASFK